MRVALTTFSLRTGFWRSDAEGLGATAACEAGSDDRDEQEEIDPTVATIPISMMNSEIRAKGLLLILTRYVESEVMDTARFNSTRLSS